MERNAEAITHAPAGPMRDLYRRIRYRLSCHPWKDFLFGLWISRHFKEHGLVVASGGFPLPKVISRGGDIYAENIQLYSGVRLEVGPVGTIRIGKGTYINRNSVVVAETLVDIGRNCRIAWDVVIMDSDLHPLPDGRPDARPVTIEENVWIGCRSIILKGVRIGTGAVVAAGAVVTKDVPPRTVVGGVPARVLRDMRPADEVAGKSYTP
jgi:acetyltransferase-like isoleucine patch superfamily enzyme